MLESVLRTAMAEYGNTKCVEVERKDGGYAQGDIGMNNREKKEIK